VGEEIPKEQSALERQHGRRKPPRSHRQSARHGNDENHTKRQLPSAASAAAADRLISYGHSLADAYRPECYYVGRILKGERPGELPVQHSVKTTLVINLKTAKALGVKIPSTLRLRADHTVQRPSAAPSSPHGSRYRLHQNWTASPRAAEQQA
jgi:hypothetical protein